LKCIEKELTRKEQNIDDKHNNQSAATKAILNGGVFKNTKKKKSGRNMTDAEEF